MLMPVSVQDVVQVLKKKKKKSVAIRSDSFGLKNVFSILYVLFTWLQAITAFIVQAAMASAVQAD